MEKKLTSSGSYVKLFPVGIKNQLTWDCKSLHEKKQKN